MKCTCSDKNWWTITAFNPREHVTRMRTTCERHLRNHTTFMYDEHVPSEVHVTSLQDRYCWWLHNPSFQVLLQRNEQDVSFHSMSLKCSLVMTAQSRRAEATEIMQFYSNLQGFCGFSSKIAISHRSPFPRNFKKSQMWVRLGPLDKHQNQLLLNIQTSHRQTSIHDSALYVLEPQGKIKRLWRLWGSAADVTNRSSQL